MPIRRFIAGLLAVLAGAAGKVPIGQGFATGPETPHCEYRFTPSCWTLRKVEVYKR